MTGFYIMEISSRQIEQLIGAIERLTRALELRPTATNNDSALIISMREQIKRRMEKKTKGAKK